MVEGAQPEVAAEEEAGNRHPMGRLKVLTEAEVFFCVVVPDKKRSCSRLLRGGASRD